MFIHNSSDFSRDLIQLTHSAKIIYKSGRLPCSFNYKKLFHIKNVVLIIIFGHKLLINLNSHGQ